MTKNVDVTGPGCARGCLSMQNVVKYVVWWTILSKNGVNWSGFTDLLDSGLSTSRPRVHHHLTEVMVPYMKADGCCLGCRQCSGSLSNYFMQLFSWLGWRWL
eukprot:scpid110654/ scgid10695/ 